MMTYSTNKDFKVEATIPVSVYTTTATGGAVDLVDCASATFVVMTNTAIVGSPVVKLQESDTGTSGWTDIDASQIVGSLPEFPIEALTTVTNIGYIGYKRYVRATFASGTSGTWGILVVKGYLRSTA